MKPALIWFLGSLSALSAVPLHSVIENVPWENMGIN